MGSLVEFTCPACGFATGKLSEKEYAGALSVELFRADIVNADPFEVATEIREKCEAVMRDAQVL